MNNHTELLNYLATTFNLQSYLEIGVQNPANNFDKIQCESKTGVDPEISPDFMKSGYGLLRMNSDTYFQNEFKYAAKSLLPYDLIFIDGLHHADQVKRDFENSLRCLNDNGFIVIHDTLPEKEEYTHVPRDSKIWNGDVYKFAVTLNKYENIDFATIRMDHGCTVVRKIEGIKYGGFPEIETWKDFQLFKKINLNVMVFEDFEKRLKAGRFYKVKAEPSVL